jgi:hypothetical protein
MKDELLRFLLEFAEVDGVLDEREELALEEIDRQLSKAER